MNNSYSMDIDTNLFMKSLRQHANQPRSLKNTPRGRNNRLAQSKEVGGTQKILNNSQSQSRELLVNIQPGSQQSSKGNLIRRLKSASKLQAKADEEESADQMVQRGLEGTKKLIQQLQVSQKRGSRDMDANSGHRVLRPDQKNNLNCSWTMMDATQINNSNRQMVLDESIVVDGFEQQNQSAITEAVHDQNTSTMIDNQLLPHNSVNTLKQIPPRSKANAYGPGSLALGKQKLLLVSSQSEFQQTNTRASEQQQTSDASSNLTKMQMLEDKIAKISVFQDRMRPLLNQIKSKDHQNSIINSQLQSKLSQERVTNKDIQVLYKSLAQKDEQLFGLLSETKNTVLPLNNQIHDQLLQQKTILERVVADMNEQRDQLSQGIKQQKNNFELVAKQRTLQMDTVLQEKINEEIASYRIEIESKIRGVKEGVHRVIQEKVDREKAVVDNRIGSLRKQIEQNREKVQTKIRGLKDRLMQVQEKMREQHKQRSFIDQDERQNPYSEGLDSQSTTKQLSRKIEKDSPSTNTAKGDMPLQMRDQTGQVEQFGETDGSRGLTVLSNSQSQSIKDIVNEQLQQFMKAQLNQQFVQQILSQAMSERSTPLHVTPQLSASKDTNVQQSNSHNSIHYQQANPKNDQVNNHIPNNTIASAQFEINDCQRENQNYDDIAISAVNPNISETNQRYTEVEQLNQSTARINESTKHDIGDIDDEQSVTQSNELPTVHHHTFKQNIIRGSPNKRSRNNSKHGHVNHSQANINLSMINNSVDEDTQFRSNINKYQRDSQKRYHPYGMKDQASSANNRADQSTSAKGLSSSDANQVKNPQIIQRQREQYVNNNNNTTLVNQSTFSKLSLQSQHSQEAVELPIQSGRTTTQYDEMPQNVINLYKQKKHSHFVGGELPGRNDPFQGQNPLSTFCSEKQTNQLTQRTELRTQIDSQSVYQRSEKTVKLESLPPSQVRINYGQKQTSQMCDFSPMVNLDTVSIQSTSHHLRNQLSHGGGNQHIQQQNNAIAIDDILACSQTDIAFAGAGKTASSALNKSQKSLQIDINKVNTTAGVMYLKTEEEQLRPSTVQVYEQVNQKDPIQEQQQPQASAATSLAGKEDIDDEDDEFESKKIHGNTPLQSAQRMISHKNEPTSILQQPYLPSTEFSNNRSYRQKIEQYRLVKQSMQNVQAFCGHSQGELAQLLDSLSTCITTNQDGLNLAIKELASLVQRYGSATAGTDKKKLSQVPEVAQMASKILNQFDSFKEYCGQENAVIIQNIQQRDQESKEMVQQIQTQLQKFNQLTNEFKNSIIDEQNQKAIEKNQIKNHQPSDQLWACTNSQRDAITKDEQKGQELKQELAKLVDQFKLSSTQLRERSQLIDSAIQHLQGYLVQQIDQNLQFFSDDMTTQDKGDRATQDAPSPSNAASSRVGKTSNVLLKEFLTQNTREDNFMSNSKALFQMYNQSILGGAESAKLRRNRRVEDESLTDLSISKDPPQGNSSLMSKNIQQETSKDLAVLNCQSKSQSKDNLLQAPSQSELLPESQASLQNTRQIDLTGLNLNLQNFHQIKEHINNRQQQKKEKSSIKGLETGVVVTDGSHQEATPESPGSDSDLDAPTVDRDEEIKCSDIEFSHLFSHVTTPHIEVASNTRHSQRFFDMSSGSQKQTGPKQQQLATSTKVETNQGSVGEHKAASPSNFNQKINKELIEIIEANSNAVPSISAVGCDDQDAASSSQQLPDYNNRVYISTIIEEDQEF